MRKNPALKVKKYKIMKNITSKINTNSLYKKSLFVGIIALSLFNLSGAHAQGMMNRYREDKEDTIRQGGKMMGLEKGQKDIIGTVTAINGNTLTVSQTIRGEGRDEGKNTATTTKIFTVDASSAKIIKAGATSSVSSILTGDRVSITGAISGTNITAKIIRDDIKGMMGRDKGEIIRNDKIDKDNASTTPEQGRGFMKKTKNFFRHMFGF